MSPSSGSLRHRALTGIETPTVTAFVAMLGNKDDDPCGKSSRAAGAQQPGGVSNLHSEPRTASPIPFLPLPALRIFDVCPLCLLRPRAKPHPGLVDFAIHRPKCLAN